jgi:sterol desaturase/sphingolipid hydroxylase (fatty acid hydroxylase superfamily)
METNLFYYLLALLLVLTILSKVGQQVLMRRNASDWILDGISLLNHFLIIPMLQVALVIPIFIFSFPELKGTINIGWGLAVLASMFIDYGWYWNHRLFHAKTRFWSLHAVHHEPQDLDIFRTPRNSLLSPLFMVYFWVIPLFIYLAQDPVPFLFVTAFSLVVNFWGHTHFNFPKDSILRRIASSFLIQPKDHYWHHSSDQTYCNFGTVFNFWDRIHGTWHASEDLPQRLGFKLNYSLGRKIFLPKNE